MEHFFDHYEDEVLKSVVSLCTNYEKMRAEKSALTATDIRSYINQMDSLEELMLAKKRMRNAVLLDSLPAEKVLQIFNAERSFNYQAIDKLRKKIYSIQFKKQSKITLYPMVLYNSLLDGLQNLLYEVHLEEQPPQLSFKKWCKLHPK